MDKRTQELDQLVNDIANHNADVLHAISHQIDKDIVNIISGLFRRAETIETIQSFLDEQTQDDPEVHSQDAVIQDQ